MIGFIDRLPDSLQNEVAEMVIDDIKNEFAWHTTLSKPLEGFDDISTKALEELSDGKAINKGFDEL